MFEQALTGEGLQKSNKPLTSFFYKEAGNTPYSRLRLGEAESPCRSQAALGGGALTALCTKGSAKGLFKSTHI